MRQGGRLLASIMGQVMKRAAPGVATKELDDLAERLIDEAGGKPSFKGPVSEGHGGFPATMCVSINEEIVHGVPSERVIREGDVVSLDIGMLYEGFHTDMAVTVATGTADPEIRRLIKVTKKALKRGIKVSRSGNRFGDIGNTIERYVSSQGFCVVRELCGHGIGRKLHEDPQILNYGKRHSGPAIREGMTFCIEPMVTRGDWHIEKKKDGQCYVTRDRSWAAHFEHTIAVVNGRPDVLTRLPGEAYPSDADNDREEDDQE